jgi:serine/threonine protein kinase
MNEREIFIAALQRQNAADRSAFLDEACGSNAELREHVEALLSEHDELGSFLESPAAVLAAPAEQPGIDIGPYRLVEQVGEGGMGLVFVAEQQYPIRRKVALKVIKPGLDTREVLARFEAERQALAMMDHPHIAKVFDAGMTETGRPYFVMELVQGVPITDYCDQNRLSPRARLELFVAVCQAVQHAHTKGIIHRDLKPSNILVATYDSRPVPKVIDFGVAKAVEQPVTEKTLFTKFGALVGAFFGVAKAAERRLTEKTLFTKFGTLVGTFEYMSPEQAEMNTLGVDTRSDVYSLGVLLYELLTGTTPLERQRLRAAALDELVRLIKEEEPPKPSVRLSSCVDLPRIAAARQTKPERLSKLVRGEIDWIVMKCLEKDRSRRYETASGLARDVERFLNDEPVGACPPSASYRLWKFTRRHRAAFATAACFVGLLMVSTGVSIWQAIRATRAEKEAREARASVSVYRELLMRDPKLSKLPADDPDRALALAQLGRFLLQHGQPAEAEPVLRECLAIREKKMPDDFRTFNARSLLGEALLGQQKYAEAEPLLLNGYQGLKQREATIPRTSFVHPPDVVEHLVRLYEACGKPEEAAKWRKKLEAARARPRNREDP